MKKIILMICTLFLCCSFTNMGMKKRDRIAYQIMGKFSKEMRISGLEGIGTGLAQKEGKLNLLRVIFKTDQVLTIESARKLSVPCLNEFLSCINARKDFKDYIIEYPLTDKNAFICIIGEDSSDQKSDFVKSVHAGEGSIRYYSGSMVPPSYGLILEETFDEAVCILNHQHVNTNALSDSQY